MSSTEAAGEHPSERAPTRATPSRWRWIPKPLLITLFGVALSAWLVPALTRQWQDRQKEREIKVALVAQIGDSTSDALVTSQFVAAQTFPKGGQSEFNRLSLDWARRTAEIEGKLAAYFPGKPLVRRWRDYSLAVQSGFYLVTSDRGSRKVAALKRVRAYIGSGPSDSRAGDRPVNWKLFRPAMHYGNPQALEDYLVVSQQLLDRREELIRTILDAHAEGFSTTGSDLIHDLLPFR